MFNEAEMNELINNKRTYNLSWYFKNLGSTWMMWSKTKKIKNKQIKIW